MNACKTEWESVGKSSSEIIVLDVCLCEMIHSRAFRAVLKNGHKLVAYIPQSLAGRFTIALQVGDVAKVMMSPFDMSCGELVTV